ncbi:MAG: dihydrofolate reductase family protein [Candidatus Sericytochromatia bacterium]|nr:dihydrofolate reductase family protein [Candidatus Sericytochromatia bacterium]
MPGRVRVFIATSLDGFIAGDNDDLSWLPQPTDAGDDGGFGAFLADVGALLMGRRTWDVVMGFDGPWPYGDRAVLVATHRPLAVPAGRGQPRSGDIRDLVASGLEAAEGRDLYVDGGQLIRQALSAGLVDELCLTQVPILLGRGIPLFSGLEGRIPLVLKSTRVLAGGLVQLTFLRA